MNGKEIIFHQKSDWKKFGHNNMIIALNVLYPKKRQINPAYISKYNSNCEKQVTLLIIPNEREG